MVRSVNFAVLGKQDIAAELGKKGTATDLTLFDRKESDTIRTWVAPSGFPDKIQPLLQAIGLAEHVIFCVDKLDRFAGEQIIALDMLQKKSGILSHTFDVDESKLEAMVRGTVVEGYLRAGQEKIREEADRMGPVAGGETPEVTIDHCFDVKGVGTVILGKVTGGTVRQYDALRLYPADAEVVIKSIQMHDDPVAESASPARVGLAVKGVRPDQVGRGDVLAGPGSCGVTSEIELDFAKSPFYKDEIAQNQGCLVSVGLQVKAAKFSSVDPLRLAFERPLVCRPGQTAVVLKPESATVRIIGSGTIR